MTTFSRRQLLQAGLSAAAGATAPAAFAQAGFPSRPIKFVVPFPPGGATDLTARLLAAKLQESWGQNVLVENKAGASGMIGSEQVLRAPADGHTVLVTITTHIQNPAIFAKVPYDPLKDFEPVSQICLSYLVLVVKPDFPASNLKEFVATVKANPGKYAFGSFGTGSSSHIVGETFARKAGLDIAHVPYKGSAPMMSDLLGGQVPCAWADVSTATQHINAGKLKPLVVTGERRAPLLASVPTLLESGYPGLEPLGWVGVLLAAGTPKPIVEKYSNEMVRIVKLPEVRARLYEQTLMPVGDNAASFARTLKRDMVLWQQIATTAGLKPQ
ncbi:MAG: tripartite tricarboxylate transporter substrate binding protein [Pseudomonadota bacterium]